MSRSHSVIKLTQWCLLLAATLLNVGADWPRWRGPSGSGQSDETDWSHQWADSGPPRRWQAAVGTGFSSVVVSQGRLYTIGNEDNRDTVYCLDAKTGGEVWSHSYDSPLDDRFFEGGPTSTPTIDGDVVYALGRQGDTFCFDAKTGVIRWSKNVAEEAEVRVPGWGFAASPVVYSEMLLLGVGETGLALNKKDGGITWKSTDADAGYATPLLFRSNNRAFAVIASAKYYHVIDVQTGEEQWRVRWLTRFGCNAADPILAAGKLFISSGYNRGSALLKLTADQPEVVWKSKAFQNQFGSSVLIGQHLYGIDGDTTGERALKCVEMESGKVVWSEIGFGSGALLSAGSRLIILSEQGELVITEAKPDHYVELARAKVVDGKCWTVPVLANGLLYCRSAEGVLVCIDLRPL